MSRRSSPGPPERRPGEPGPLQPQPSGVPARNNAAGAPGPPGAAREGGHMPTEAKRATVAELTTILEASTSSIVADYRGLKVSETSAARRSLREKGIGYHVVKNRLARIAAEQAGIAELSPLLQGPTALALGTDDEARLARVFLEAIPPYKSVVVRGGGNRGRGQRPG